MTIETGQIIFAVVLALLAACKSMGAVEISVPREYLADVVSALAPDPAGLTAPP